MDQQKTAHYTSSHPDDLPQAADCTVAQPLHLYTAQDHATWKTLYERQEQVLEGRACDGFNIMFPHVPEGLDDFVDKVVPELQARGLTIAQPPTDMEFGRTFTALDPDGHRLRVYWPSPA